MHIPYNPVLLNSVYHSDMVYITSNLLNFVKFNSGVEIITHMRRARVLHVISVGRSFLFEVAELPQIVLHTPTSDKIHIYITHINTIY